jgi:hypothetical protein
MEKNDKPDEVAIAPDDKRVIQILLWALNRNPHWPRVLSIRLPVEAYCLVKAFCHGLVPVGLSTALDLFAICQESILCPWRSKAHARQIDGVVLAF